MEDIPALLSNQPKSKNPIGKITDMASRRKLSSNDDDVGQS